MKKQLTDWFHWTDNQLKNVHILSFLNWKSRGQVLRWGEHAAAAGDSVKTSNH